MSDLNTWKSMRNQTGPHSWCFNTSVQDAKSSAYFRTVEELQAALDDPRMGGRISLRRAIQAELNKKKKAVPK